MDGANTLAKREGVSVIVRRALEAAAGNIEELAGEVGVSYGTVWAWARGRRNPSPGNLRRLATALRRRSEDLAELAGELERAAES